MYTMITELIGAAGYALEAVGVVVILFGAARATVRGFRQSFRTPRLDLYREFRLEFGRAMMLGLEFLVAGDIIRTVVVDHSMADVAGLGLVVLIRTVLVFTIHLEVEGRWPWQAKSASHKAEGGNHA